MTQSGAVIVASPAINWKKWSRARSRWVPLLRRSAAYAVAVLGPTLIFALRDTAGFSPGDPPGLVMFVLPIALAAFVGGLGPGLACTALSAVLSRGLIAGTDATPED